VQGKIKKVTYLEKYKEIEVRSEKKSKGITEKSVIKHFCFFCAVWGLLGNARIKQNQKN
jgi:hypothetical protein